MYKTHYDISDRLAEIMTGIDIFLKENEGKIKILSTQIFQETHSGSRLNYMYLAYLVYEEIESNETTNTESEKEIVRLDYKGYTVEVRRVETNTIEGTHLYIIKICEEGDGARVFVNAVENKYDIIYNIELAKTTVDYFV